MGWTVLIYYCGLWVGTFQWTRPGSFLGASGRMNPTYSSWLSRKERCCEQKQRWLLVSQRQESNEITLARYTQPSELRCSHLSLMLCPNGKDPVSAQVGRITDWFFAFVLPALGPFSMFYIKRIPACRPPATLRLEHPIFWTTSVAQQNFLQWWGCSVSVLSGEVVISHVWLSSI